MEGHVFISHSERDADLAREIAKALEGAGCATWYYERDSLPGPAYLSQVGDAIDSAATVIVIASRASLSSQQVTNEVVRAYESAKPFMPVLSGLAHVELQSQPVWRQALGAATSIELQTGRVRRVLPKLLAGLEVLTKSAAAVRAGDKTASVASVAPTPRTPHVGSSVAKRRVRAPDVKHDGPHPSGRPRSLSTRSVVGQGGTKSVSSRPPRGTIVWSTDFSKGSPRPRIAWHKSKEKNKAGGWHPRSRGGRGNGPSLKCVSGEYNYDGDRNILILHPREGFKMFHNSDRVYCELSVLAPKGAWFELALQAYKQKRRKWIDVYSARRRATASEDWQSLGWEAVLEPPAGYDFARDKLFAYLIVRVPADSSVRIDQIALGRRK